MELSITRKPSHVRVGLIGQFWDVADLRNLEQEVERVAQDGGPAVVLDLERVTFINSNGLGKLVRIYSNLKERSIPLVLFHPVQHVREAIELAGFDALMPVLETEEQLASVIAPPGSTPAGA